jgi:AraC-like DNA-binding protein
MDRYPGDDLTAVADYEPIVGLELSDRQPFFYAEFLTRSTKGSLFHMHYAMELGIVTKGSMERYFPDGRIILRPGDVWLTSPLEPHWWRVPQKGTRIAVFHFFPEFLASLRFQEAPDLKLMAPFVVPPLARPRSTARKRKQVLEWMARIRALPDNAFKPIRLHLLLMEGLVLLHEGWTPPERVQEKVSFGRLTPAIRLVFDTRRYIPTAAAAKACSLSRNRFHELFLQLMGLSFSDFALRYRLSRAARELHETRDPVKAIAERWGFADVSHFHRLFTEIYRCSPRTYREGQGLQSSTPQPK